MLRKISIQWMLVLAVACAGPALADTDPTVHQIYEAESAGHREQAHQMMNQVLRDHPDSGKAHYVAAELYAKEGNASMARQELSTAERLAPGLPFAKPDSVHALQRELQGRPHAVSPFQAQPDAPASRGTFPWSIVLVVVIGVGILWAFMRRRAPAAVYSQNPAAYPGATPGAPGYMGPGPNLGGGSGIMGSLGTGLAIGAGVAAGEELVRHVFDSDHHPGAVSPAENSGFDRAQNEDMGGTDFGTSSDSWDDGGSGGDVGGDGWT